MPAMFAHDGVLLDEHGRPLFDSDPDAQPVDAWREPSTVEGREPLTVEGREPATVRG